MRAQCCICSDLFVNDVDIAATPCGHVFHEHCLARWLATSSTCPQCRKHLVRSSVIPKLYFDLADDDHKQEDPDKLSNEVQSLRTRLSELQQKNSKSKSRKKDLKDKLKSKDDEIEGLGSLLRREQDTVASLQRLLKQMEAQKSRHEEERAEFIRTQRKFTELKHVEVLISGGERETEAILQQYCNGDKQQLARYCAILKREYEQARAEKRALKEQLEKYKKTAYTTSKDLSEAKAQLQLLKEQLSRSEEDLKVAEKNHGILSAKYNKLKYSRSHRVDTSGSFTSTPQSQHPAWAAEDLSMSSKTPKIDLGNITPQMSRPSEGVNLINFSEKETPPERRIVTSPDLFADSPGTQVKKACEENNVRTVKLSSAASAPKRLKKASDGVLTNPLPLSTLNIMKKRTGGLMNISKTIVRKDYNGLGGTSKFTQPVGPKVSFLKSSSSRSVHRTKLGSKKSNPPLPTLDSFVDLT